jgi:hypothetical protein
LNVGATVSKQALEADAHTLADETTCDGYSIPGGIEPVRLGRAVFSAEHI